MQPSLFFIATCSWHSSSPLLILQRTLSDGQYIPQVFRDSETHPQAPTCRPASDTTLFTWSIHRDHMQAFKGLLWSMVNAANVYTRQCETCVSLDCIHFSTKQPQTSLEKMAIFWDLVVSRVEEEVSGHQGSSITYSLNSIVHFRDATQTLNVLHLQGHFFASEIDLVTSSMSLWS